MGAPAFIPDSVVVVEPVGTYIQLPGQDVRLYAQYKTAPTEEQREQARQEYLDRRGVPESFRW